jgi:uncharacterized membrane protein YccF (DUF307 family)
MNRGENYMTNQASQSQKPPVVIVQGKKGPGCLIQALWFIFVGWWLGAILISIAWFLNITIIGLPLGMSILNSIPKILALQEPQTQTRTFTTQSGIVITESEQPQLNFWVRAIYFVVIGWWWSGIWLAIAYLLCDTIILIPIGLKMFRATPAMTTLRRY